MSPLKSPLFSSRVILLAKKKKKKKKKSSTAPLIASSLLSAFLSREDKKSRECLMCEKSLLVVLSE